MAKEFIYVADLKILLVRQKNFRNLNLRVNHNDGSLRINAPLAVAESYIENFVLKNLTNIKLAISKINAAPKIEAPKFIDGELHSLWGEKYPLKIVEASYNQVSLQSENLLIELTPNYFNHPESHKIRQHYLNEFYRHQLQQAIQPIMQQRLQQMNLSISEWRIKNMKTRWGTCNITQKRIWLNLQLAKKPLQCLDLVIVHELAHLLERKHTPRFHAIVAKYYPEWQSSEKLLQNSHINTC